MVHPDGHHLCMSSQEKQEPVRLYHDGGHISPYHGGGFSFRQESVRHQQDGAEFEVRTACNEAGA